IIGLSGLITPSLEEMGIVAEEMDKAGFSMPLLIGGATTSKLHTALKIEHRYSRGAVVYVKDASQSPSAVGNLMSVENRDAYVAKVRSEYALLREGHAMKVTELVSLEEARRNAFRPVNNYEPVPPRTMGRV